ncbi:MAG: tRNA pseudouridine(65) synthase TruC [Alteromonadaceae bacterium]|nr:tRNA pseudouridine(65) synthase TruC [Alteromonadaceae bacterium]
MLDILFQDEALVAINKPSGLLVHRSMIDKHETEFAMQMVRDQIGQHVFPVHRLDKPTSGILVFALSSNIARLLSAQIEQHSWQKAYTAIVRGWASDCEIDYALKEKLDKISDKKAYTEKPAQEAFTRVECLQHYLVPKPVGRYQQARFSLIRCFPKTGRKHQIRRHCAHINHPIVGDTTIGDGKQNAFMRAHYGLHRLALHHHELQFVHPITDSPLTITAPKPLELRAVVDKLTIHAVGETIHHGTN